MYLNQTLCDEEQLLLRGHSNTWHFLTGLFLDTNDADMFTFICKTRWRVRIQVYYRTRFLHKFSLTKLFPIFSGSSCFTLTWLHSFKNTGRKLLNQRRKNWWSKKLDGKNDLRQEHQSIIFFHRLLPYVANSNLYIRLHPCSHWTFCTTFCRKCFLNYSFWLPWWCEAATIQTFTNMKGKSIGISYFSGNLKTELHCMKNLTIPLSWLNELTMWFIKWCF